MNRTIGCLLNLCVASLAWGLSLSDFAPVHKARLTPEGTNQLRLQLPSAEWDSGLRLEANPPLDLSQAQWLLIDVENLSPNRQARLTLHLSAGAEGGDSSDHATAIFRKHRSINTGIGLNPKEKGTLRLFLPHLELYGAPATARGMVAIDTKKVTRIELKMQWPFEDEVEDLADLRLSNLRLEGTPDRSRKVPTDRYCPFVDPYGQFAHATWRAKVTNDLQLVKDLAAERRHLLPPPKVWDRYGGWADGPALQATGHFRTTKYQGKWWLVTPEGKLFFSVGIDVARIMTDITDGRKHPDWFQTPLPEDGKYPFTIWNLEKKFGTKDFAASYYDLMIQRFDCWGINTIGNWSADALIDLGRKPYVISVLERAKGVPRHPKFHLYDLASPDFEPRFRAAIRARFAENATLQRAAKDPLCIGFFIDNELQFHKWIPAVGEAAARPLVERYFRICREELNRLAPNKLYLGSRFVGFRQPGVLWEMAGKYCDVITVNAYGNSIYNISEKIFADGRQERPILIGEFHYGCFDRGMFKPGLAPVPDQAERGRSYTRFVEGALQHPLFVGCHWFQYRDQPLLGRGDGEAYQIGFVDVCDRPYPELTRAARRLAQVLYEKRLNGVW